MIEHEEVKTVQNARVEQNPKTLKMSLIPSLDADLLSPVADQRQIEEEQQT
jgi:hypothetical protein